MKKYNTLVLPILLTVLLLFTGSASTAYAHANLLKTVPQQGAVVPSTPTELSLTFSEALEPDLISLKLYDRNGERIDLPKPQLAKGNPQQALVTLPPLEEGSYTVVWSIVSEDGHPVSESYTFSVGQATPVFPPSDQPSEEELKMLDSLIILLRYSVEGLLLVGAGFSIIARFAERFELPGSRTLLGRKAPVFWALLLLGTIGEWLAYSGTIPHMSMSEALMDGDWSLVSQSRFATMILTQFGLLLLLALPSMMPAWYGMIWVLLVANLALGGHAWAVTPLTGSFIARTLHLLTIAAWLGALAYLLQTMRKSHDDAKLNRTAFRRFFLRVVITSSVLVVLTGVWMALMQTSVTLLLQTGPLWNRLLFLKVGMLVIMLLLALFQTLRWQREQGSLSYNLLRFELLVGALIVQLGIWMSQIPYPIPYPIP